MERLTAGSPAPTHDLIRLREPIALTVDAPVPAWVEPALRRAPWVVVRRGRVHDGIQRLKRGCFDLTDLIRHSSSSRTKAK